MHIYVRNIYFRHRYWLIITTLGTHTNPYYKHHTCITCYTNSYLVNELTSHRHLNLLSLWLGKRQQTTTQNRNNKKMNDIPCIVLFIFQFAKFHSCLFWHQFVFDSRLVMFSRVFVCYFFFAPGLYLQRMYLNKKRNNIHVCEIVCVIN